MGAESLFPIRGGLSGRAGKAERSRIGRFAVDALVKLLRDTTGSFHRLVPQSEDAPDWEVVNETTGATIGIELVDDFSWHELQALKNPPLESQTASFVDIPVEDPRYSLYEVVRKKHAKHQLVGYPEGRRVLLVGLARVGAAVIGIDVLGVEELRRSVIYMDELPSIDHLFVWWATSDGPAIERLWSRTQLP